MDIFAKQGGAWRSGKLTVKDGGNVEIRKGFVKKGGSWRQFYRGAPPLSVTATPSTVVGRGGAGTTVTTGTTTAEVSGGIGPFTYFWRRQIGDTSISPVDADGRITAFRGPGGAERSARFEVEVTDQETGEKAKATVNVSIYDDLFTGGGGVQP